MKHNKRKIIFSSLLTILLLTGGQLRAGDFPWQLFLPKIKVKSVISGGTDVVLYTRNNCPSPLSDNVSENQLDLSNPKVKAINDALKTADPDNAYLLFLRGHDDFMYWIEDRNVSLVVATHETNHFYNSELYAPCLPKFKEKYFSLRKIFITNFDFSTENYSIVEEAIPSVLKSAHRYETYIEGSKPYDGNRFNVLLDELNAYVGDAWFQLKFIESGLLRETENYEAYGSFPAIPVLTALRLFCLTESRQS